MAQYDVRHRFLTLLLCGASVALFAPSSIAAPARAGALERVAAGTPSNDIAHGLIIRYDPAKGAVPFAPDARANAVNLALRSFGRGLSHVRVLGTGADVLRFDQSTLLADAEDMARVAATLPGVRYAVVDRPTRTQLLPTDPEFLTSTQISAGQWGFRYVSGLFEGANFVAAWNVTTGSPSQTIGVVDTGISIAHDDLSSQLRVQPNFPNGGYDFISSVGSSGDGDGRDDNPSPPDACNFNTQHGTHVSGTIAAQTSFSGGGIGGAGGAPSAKLLMARGLADLFSGSDSDAIDGMLWVAGVSVAGVADNQYPARVINMSFSAPSVCGGAYQDAIDALRAHGAVPVVAAGNSNVNVANSAPANCRGVIAVAATDILGERAGFSNFGAGVTVAAPGVSILSTCGTTSGMSVKSGTSMAAPHVTAAVALMQAAQPSLSINQAVLGIRAGARAFPGSSSCTTAICGAGLLDASNSVNAVIGSAAYAGWNESAASVLESAGSASFTVARIGNNPGSVSAMVATVNGTALSGLDFGSPSPSTLTWAAGDTTERTVTVPIVHRLGEQGARSFNLQLSNPTSGLTLVTPTSVVVNIAEVDCASVIPITVGATATGALDVAHPENYCHGGVRGAAFNTVRYSFSGTAGDVVSIDYTSTNVGSPVLDTYLYLLSPTLQIIAENDDVANGSNRNSRLLQVTLTTTGTHYIDATTWSANVEATGSYTLHLYGCGGPYAAGTTCNLDVDGDGIVDQTDALIALRRILGMNGATLPASVSFRGCASRQTGALLAPFIDGQLAPTGPGGARAYDIDGDGQVLATTDGLMLLRAALGMPGAAIVANATAPGAPRNTWPLVQPYLAMQCGLTLPP